MVDEKYELILVIYPYCIYHLEYIFYQLWEVKPNVMVLWTYYFFNPPPPPYPDIYPSMTYYNKLVLGE